MEFRLVKIYSSETSPRLKYITDLLFNDILGLPSEIVTDRRRIGKNPVINYSDDNIPGAFKIAPAGLLSETGIKPHHISVTRWKDLPVFFELDDGSDFPFDIFAASFYIVTRYEEYDGFTPDEYDRFRSSDSLAYRNGFLEIPVVELWMKEFSGAILRKYPFLTFKRREYRAVSTIDVDEAFAYLGKSLFGNITGFIHDITTKTGHPDHRLECLRGEKKDPFEVFDYITGAVKKNRAETCFFFPTGDNSAYDKNPSWKNEEYRSLIQKTSEKFRTGIHPSFRASDNFSLIEREITRLSTIMGNDIRMSRFHFLRIRFPVSYRNLQGAGITEDYSMGYSDEPGFRAGLARPFRFYDIAAEQVTNLLIIPFQVMDETLFRKCGDDIDKAKKLIRDLILETRKSGGVFVSIWHNTSLVDSPEYRKWREVFEFMLKNQIP